MCVAPLGTRGAPVQVRWGLHRRLPEHGATAGKRLGMGMMGEPIRPNRPGVGPGTCSSHAGESR